MKEKKYINKKLAWYLPLRDAKLKLLIPMHTNENRELHTFYISYIYFGSWMK